MLCCSVGKACGVRMAVTTCGLSFRHASPRLMSIKVHGIVHENKGNSAYATDVHRLRGVIGRMRLVHLKRV